MTAAHVYDPYHEYTPIYADELDEYEEDEVELVESVYLYP